MDYFEALGQISQPIRANNLPQTLDHIHRLLAALDNPQQAYPCVVVAGSVGKGTTCYQIAALMNPHLKVGLYTSPHLHSFRERFLINDQRISQAEFIDGFEVVQTATHELETHYSTFELATALALWWFRQQAIDIAVLEIGIGGRYDAVNAVGNALAVITPIELEHAAMLGGTLTSIASHKAGIIQPHGDALSAPQISEVEAVLRQEATKQDASLHFSSIDTLAVTACNHLMQRGIIPTFSLPDKAPIVHVPGRVEIVERNGKTLLIDGAHTPFSARRLREIIRQIAPDTSFEIIIGMLRDKSVQKFIAEFDSPEFHITLTQTSSHRALKAEEIEQAILVTKASISIEIDLRTAIDRALTSQFSFIVITGSLRMAALTREALGLLTPEELDEAERTRAIFEGRDYLSKLR